MRDILLSQTMKTYRHIEEKDRRRIAKLKSYRLKVSEIARRTGFNKSTISRELKRNSYLCPLTKNNLVYSRRTAQARAEGKLKRSKSHPRVTQKTFEWVEEKLKENWSPQQIAGRSKLLGPQKISHEYVYQFIYNDKRNGGKLYKLLKRFRKRKRRLSSRDYKLPTIPERKSILERPKAAERRCRLGDLEGDFILGKDHSGNVLTVVDRKSRQVALEFLRRRMKIQVRSALIKAIKRLPNSKTLTLDNAREFSCHIEFTKLTGIKVYFADPYASHQRGTVENTNGLIRYYLPKKMSFKNLTSQKLKRIEDKLNNRPRKTLGYLTPNEVGRKSKNRVALRS